LKGNEPIIFDFLVQMRRKSILKTHQKSGTKKTYLFVKVATITTPSPQDVDNTKTISECELLAFTPWHALPEHQPVGSINRLRKTIYDTSAEHRLGK